MNKDVWVSVAGLQFSGSGEEEKIEILTPGSYYRKKDHHYVLYDEVVEGSDEITKNTVKFDGDMLTISKRGFTNVEMIFEEKGDMIVLYLYIYKDKPYSIDDVMLTLRFAQ